MVKNYLTLAIVSRQICLVLHILRGLVKSLGPAHSKLVKQMRRQNFGAHNFKKQEYDCNKRKDQENGLDQVAN